MYRIKGFKRVRIRFHTQFPAYEFNLEDECFLSVGPGWSYCEEYLSNLLFASYNYFYMPKSGDCVVDIGAGLGEETVIYSKLVGVSGRVLAVEANPYVYEGLKYLCENNGFTWTSPINVAVYKEAGEVTIEDNAENYLRNTINTASGSNGLNVKALTFDSIIADNNIQQIDFLKVNIEGAEQFMIEGMSNSIRLINHLCISCHDFRHNNNGESEFYVTKARIVAFLLKNGFDVQSRTTGNSLIDDYVYAWKKK